jgi:hypothetical protein
MKANFEAFGDVKYGFLFPVDPVFGIRENPPGEKDRIDTIIIRNMLSFVLWDNFSDVFIIIKL